MIAGRGALRGQGSRRSPPGTGQQSLPGEVLRPGQPLCQLRQGGARAASGQNDRGPALPFPSMAMIALFSSHSQAVPSCVPWSSPCRCAALVDEGGPRSPCWQLRRACPQHPVDRLERPVNASSDLRNMCLKAIQWWGDELDRLGVDLRLGQEGSPADVVELQPSVTLLATGSRPIGAATDSALPAARIRGHSPGWSHQRPFCYVFQPVL